MVLCYTVSFLLIIVSVFFYTGKALSYIAGYQNMPEEEKKTINIKPLCKNLSAMFFLAAIIFTLAGISEVFRTGHFKWAMVAWIILCVADAYFISKSKRYVNETAVVQKKSRGRQKQRYN